VMQDGWKKDKDADPTPAELMDVVTGMYCMERLGIRHDLKEEVLQFLQVFLFPPNQCIVFYKGLRLN
jgi:hypothetical protein